MKIGITTFVTDEGISGPKLGMALEERGFESLFLPEHSHIPASRRSPAPGGGELPREYYRALDPFITLGAVAAVTERLVLGTGITLLIQRDVIHTAKEIATLDRISNGRFVFGVGAGWNPEEMADHGTSNCGPSGGFGPMNSRNSMAVSSISIRCTPGPNPFGSHPSSSAAAHRRRNGRSGTAWVGCPPRYPTPPKSRPS
ncbi:LLM class flavin-dependent oxidoreductase [Nocardia arthritidis]|uniref:LLM class flavin-dependent oxidoreductase n=1 Tax=Nocardia arthritidis TaxID=228602 RepID=A0A6G9Y5W5_9NOCA|nr:LLM class flavin-dependent oxidoreductase [Nocardia arthritidis]